MATAQKNMFVSASESLNAQVTDASQAFAHSMQEMARLSIERWRLKLAANLNALAKNLGDQFQLEGESGDREN